MDHYDTQSLIGFQCWINISGFVSAQRFPCSLYFGLLLPGSGILKEVLMEVGDISSKNFDP